MCNDTMKISQELSKDNTKSFEEKSISKENENEKTATTGYKEKEKAITSNETSSETINRKTDDVYNAQKLVVQKRVNRINQKVKM